LLLARFVPSSLLFVRRGGILELIYGISRYTRNPYSFSTTPFSRFFKDLYLGDSIAFVNCYAINLAYLVFAPLCSYGGLRIHLRPPQAGYSSSATPYSQENFKEHFTCYLVPCPLLSIY